MNEITCERQCTITMGIDDLNKGQYAVIVGSWIEPQLSRIVVGVAHESIAAIDLDGRLYLKKDEITVRLLNAHEVITIKPNTK